MGLRDYSKSRYNYRARQTRLHRRNILQGRRVSIIVRKHYLVFLTLLVIANFIYTASINKPTQAVKPIIHTVEVKAVRQPKQDTHAQLAAFNLPSMSFAKAFTAFAAEAKPTLIPVPTSTDNWEAFKETAHSIAKIYDYPANLLIAQAALESGHGTSNFALNRNNYFGIGAYDWQPNQAFQYDNAAQSIIDYIYVIKNNFPEAWGNRNDAATMLTLLENNSNGSQYASDPNYVTKVESESEWNER